MAEATSGPLSISMNTSAVKTAIPRMVESWHLFKLNGVKQKTLPGKGDIIEFEFQLVNPAKDTDGGDIAPNGLGSKVFSNVFLFGKDGQEAVMERAQKNIGKILDGLLGTGDPGNTKNKPVRPDFGPALLPSLIGQQTYGNVKHPSDPQYGPEIKEFKFPGDVTA